MRNNAIIYLKKKKTKTRENKRWKNEVWSSGAYLTSLGQVGFSIEANIDSWSKFWGLFSCLCVSFLLELGWADGAFEIPKIIRQMWDWEISGSGMPRKKEEIRKVKRQWKKEGRKELSYFHVLRMEEEETKRQEERVVRSIAKAWYFIARYYDRTLQLPPKKSPTLRHTI